MADGISITDLEQKAEVADNDNFAVDNGAITNKVTAKQIKDYMGPTYVKKAGDTMTGPLIVPDVSSGSNDNTVINSKWANGLFVKKAGDTMTGALKVSSPEFSANDTTVPNTAWVRSYILSRVDNDAPDTSAAIVANISNSTSYTCPSSGWIVLQNGGSFGTYNIMLNGVQIARRGAYQTWESFAQAQIRVVAGDIISISDGSGNINVCFMPLKK